MSEIHIPVLRNEITALMNPEPGGIYVDATVGLGGHSICILDKSFPTGQLVGIDRDACALAIAKKRLRTYKERFRLIHGNYADLPKLLESHGFYTVDGVLMDLGVSSLQIDTPERGFSFQHSGPLDMRMDRQICVSATQIINDSTPDKLIRVFTEYGEERYTKKIVKQIIAERERKPINTTHHLANIIENVYSSNTKYSKRPSNKNKSIHPATRVFQALRIEVNAELDNLTLGLEAAVSVLKPGGCLCVISFHSLEDRIVKQIFRKHGKTCICPPKTPICICEHKKSLRVITNKPVNPTATEIELNPRARSAKLRAAIKV